MLKALRIYLFLTLVTGFLYPYLITGISQVLFHKKANGTLIYRNNIAIGSELIGQKFTRDEYFWSRPSNSDYSASPSSASQYSVSSEMFKESVSKNRSRFNQYITPDDLLTASASGLDPHLSPEAIYSQAPRVAVARGLSEPQFEKLNLVIDELIEEKSFGFMGSRRINVLKLNIKIDEVFKK